MKDLDMTLVRDVLTKIITPEREIGLNDALPDLGLDSVRTVEVFVSLEDALDITFPDEALSMENFGSLAAIVALIKDVRAATETSS